MPSSFSGPAPPRVAILVDTSTNWGREIIKGVTKYAREHGPWMLFVENRGVQEELALPRNWRGEGVIARVTRKRMADSLSRRGFPVVNVSALLPTLARFPRIANNLDEVAKMAACYLFDRGFRNFGYLSLQGLEYANRQEDTFVSDLQRRGCHCAIYRVNPHEGAPSPDWNMNIRALGNWLKSLPKPVAILSWSGGSEIIHACRLAELAVPEQVAVLSGTDDLVCEISHPTISGIRPASEQIGYDAAACLARLMRGERVSMSPKYLAPLGVVTRQSTDTLAVHDDILVRAIDYIRRNAAQAIQVDDVAAAAGASRRVLERRFTEFLQRTPADQILMVRMERARELLGSSDRSMAELAEACGFRSPEYFNYVFKKETGMTPLKYRRNVRRR